MGGGATSSSWNPFLKALPPTFPQLPSPRSPGEAVLLWSVEAEHSLADSLL